MDKTWCEKSQSPIETVTTDTDVIVQRALKVGASNDRYEREADAVADDIVRRLATGPHPVADEVGGTRVVRKTDSEHVAAPPVAIAARVQRMADRREQTEPAVGAEGGNVDGRVERAVRSTSGGRPLGDGLRTSMEGAFGADFGSVKIHKNSPVAGSIGAKAFTHGNQVHFAPGTYEPATREGQHLIAHELTHTLQQGGAQRAMRRVADVQRAGHKETGLKKKGAIGAFSKKVKERTTGGKNPMGSTKAWDTLNADARVGKFTKYVNASLSKTHVPTVGYTLDPATDAGDAEFDFTTWKLTVGSNGLDAPMSDDALAEMADGVYHESRHAEQWFRIARLKAGESPAPTAASLASTLFIPATVAAAAVKRPLKPLTKAQKFFHTKKYAERQVVKMAEAESWYQSVYGSGAVSREAVMADLGNRYDDYRALSEEVDAWDVGGKTGAKLRELMAAVRVKQAAAKKAKDDRAAAKAAKKQPAVV